MKNMGEFRWNKHDIWRRNGQCHDTTYLKGRQDKWTRSPGQMDNVMTRLTLKVALKGPPAKVALITWMKESLSTDNVFPKFWSQCMKKNGYEKLWYAIRQINTYNVTNINCLYENILPSDVVNSRPPDLAFCSILFTAERTLLLLEGSGLSWKAEWNIAEKMMYIFMMLLMYNFICYTGQEVCQDFCYQILTY